ncbi:MAG TPA: hypothetical protein VFL93_09030 [Longimicrobiaceae bacterium]|nr:hypothetical protein [Longimicrobiaceae bacterium]
MGNHSRTDLDLARDELLSHIHRCGVLQSTPAQRQEWLEDTVGYLAERHPQLSTEELSELRMIGERFCQPVIPHGRGNTALTMGADQEGETAGVGE